MTRHDHGTTCSVWQNVEQRRKSFQQCLGLILSSL